jgi:TolB-like protein
MLGVLLLAVGYLAGRAHDPEPPQAIRVPVAPAQGPLAVLPFVNRSPGGEDPLSDSIPQALIEALEGEGLRVLPYEAALQFRNRAVPIRQVAEELGAGTVLEGSVHRSGNRLRIRVQLIQAPGGAHLWSKTFERKPGDLPAVRREIVREVLRALRPRVTALRVQSEGAPSDAGSRGR